MEQEMNSMPTETGARQFARVCDILDRHQRKPSQLIPILQEVQEEYRYLPEEVLTFVATSLGLPPARVYGVATFFLALYAETARKIHDSPVRRDGLPRSRLDYDSRSVAQAAES